MNWAIEGVIPDGLPGLSRENVDKVVERTGGVPLFVEKVR
jgi:hypothetical protein